MAKRERKRGEYGMGRIFQRGEIWWIAYSKRGKQYRESTKKRERQAAVDLLQQRLVGGPTSRTMLQDLFTLVEQDYRRRELRSLGRAKQAMAHMREFFGEKARAEDVTGPQANAYADHRLKEKAARATVQYELRMLSRAFTLGRRAEMVDSKPALPSVSVDNARSGCPEPETVARLLEALPQGVRELVEFLSITGWRRSEGSTLQWSQVDFRTGRVTLRSIHTKTKQPRVFPFAHHPRLLELLQEQRRRASQIERERSRIVSAVFFADDGAMIQEFRKSWKDASEAAGVPWLILHDLRRYAAVQMIRKGVGEHVAMSLLGHKTPHIFRRYHILSGDDLEAGVARLALGTNRGQGDPVAEKHEQG